MKPTMDELQRQAYMQAMGVDCYIPRLQLPAALPSVLCEMPALAEVPVANAVTHKTSASAAPAPKTKNGSAAAMQALLGETKPKQSQQSTQAVTEALVATTPAQAIPQFALSIVRGGNILIVDDGSVSYTHLTLPTKRIV